MMDMMDISNEIQDSLGRSYSVPDDIDEDELLGGKHTCYFCFFRMIDFHDFMLFLMDGYVVMQNLMLWRLTWKLKVKGYLLIFNLIPNPI